MIIRSAALVFGLKRLLELTRTPSAGREDTIGKPALSRGHIAKADKSNSTGGNCRVPVLATYQPPLPIARVAIGEIRWSAVDAHRARLLLPFENAVIGNVAPQQIPPIAEIDRALGPAATRRQPFDTGELEPVFLEEGIERGDDRIRIARRDFCDRCPPASEKGEGRGYMAKASSASVGDTRQ